MPKNRFVGLVVALLPPLLASCASITKGTSQAINVNTANCNEATSCTATNKKGTWEFSAPGPVTIKKSDDALVLRCKDGDGYVTRTIMPNDDAMVWGNVLLGGVVGAAVDSNTDAHWEVPDSITLNRENCPDK